MNYTYTITMTNEPRYGFKIYNDKEENILTAHCMWEFIEAAEYAASQLIKTIEKYTEEL